MSLSSTLQIGALLGSGHFGDVHAGTDPVHGKVAIKIFRQGLGESDADWRARAASLLDEGRLLAAATHKNVVRVFYVDESPSGDAVHLVMECCGGGSLQNPYESGPVPALDVRRIMTDIALGLQALHSRQMIHRDIKPGNLLIDDTGTAKLGDFGLVSDRIVLGYASQNGYLDHVAIEVWHGSGTSVRTDIWAFGMTVYRLLHGALWHGRNVSPKTIIQDGGFADTLDWLPHISSEWRRFIRSCLNDDPSLRYPNAHEVICAIGKLPVEPQWKCEIFPLEVKWSRKNQTRNVLVRWLQHSPRTYTWEAISEPLGAGNKRRLGGSSKKLGRVDSGRELRRFFATHV